MKQNEKSTIVGFTTDPYNNIYGYALVFFRLFDYIQKHSKRKVLLFSNDGVCSTMVKNNSFSTIKLNKCTGMLRKTTAELIYFYSSAMKVGKDCVFVVNCEIPELIVGVVLTLRGRDVYALFQDDRVRDQRIPTIVICKLRMILLARMKNVLFTNKFTMKRVKGSFKSYYLGNPVFTI